MNEKDQDKASISPTPDKSASEYSTHPSASLQSVIKHNEDLMARLSVTLRRVGHLEKVVEDMALRLKVEKSNSDSLRDELLIYTEKNRLSESQLLKNLADLSRYKKSTENLELNAQSLKSEIQTIESKYEFKISHLELEVHELAKIKEDVDTNLKPKLSAYQEHSKALESNLELLQSKNEDLKEKLLSLSQQAQSEALRFQNVSKDLQHKLKEKDLIISKFESLDDKLKALSKDKAILENKSIDLEHELKKTTTIKNSDSEKHQIESSAKNIEIQKLKIENYELKKSWAESNNKTKDLEQRLNALEEQSQSMQFMWQEKNRKHTELESQVKILETMRHELSLKSKANEQEMKSKTQKINDLLSLIETMKSKGQHEKEAILETAIRGMQSLSFEEEITPSTDVIKTIGF